MLIRIRNLENVSQEDYRPGIADYKLYPINDAEAAGEFANEVDGEGEYHWLFFKGTRVLFLDEEGWREGPLKLQISGEHRAVVQAAVDHYADYVEGRERLKQRDVVRAVSFMVPALAATLELFCEVWACVGQELKARGFEREDAVTDDAPRQVG
jgi:hypothetical protein